MTTMAVITVSSCFGSVICHLFAQATRLAELTSTVLALRVFTAHADSPVLCRVAAPPVPVRGVGSALRAVQGVRRLGAFERSALTSGVLDRARAHAAAYTYFMFQLGCRPA